MMSAYYILVSMRNERGPQLTPAERAAQIIRTARGYVAHNAISYAHDVITQTITARNAPDGYAIDKDGNKTAEGKVIQYGEHLALLTHDDLGPYIFMPNHLGNGSEIRIS